MYDYRLLESLTAVAQYEGFERAAEHLCITQSAVSQRIRQLEEQTGMVLITRSSPVRATEAGKRLIRLCSEVQLLEQELSNEQQGRSRLRLTIGVNADSLATWFLPAVSRFVSREQILIELLCDDQDQTMSMLQSGEAAGCVSSSSRKVQGCRCVPLGTMRYIPVATPGFPERWFPGGMDESSVLKAPGVVFDRKDMLHRKFLAGITDADTPVHGIPSSQMFLRWILFGHAWGMVPLIQCSDQLKEGILIHLPGGGLDVPLYWHCWNMDSSLLQELTSSVVTGSRSLLGPA